MKTKILAMYLPQYHTFKENDEWWGKGHTEWVSCKASKSLYKNHYQPRIPLNKNYYDLSTVDEQIKQAELAKKYSIYGFCYYHYWFNGKILMQKPLENMLNTPEINIPFCISWANHTWTQSPKKSDQKRVLIKQEYGDEKDWIKHFNYLLNYFNDDRYIKIDGKPMLIIYDAKGITEWSKMQKCWNKLAVEAGFSGIYYVSTIKYENEIKITSNMNFDAQFEYQPTYALSRGNFLNYAWYANIKRVVCRDIIHRPCVLNYDKVWKRVLKSNHNGQLKTFLGAYNDWDTTARWGKAGIVHQGASPEKFKKYFQMQYKRSNNLKNEFMFFTAWNEWSEGAYLEADEKNKYGYLEAIRDVVKNDGNK